MRMIAFVLTATAVSTPAAAQNWQEYSYPEYAFTVAFPANPQVETMTYQAANGRSVPQRIYRVYGRSLGVRGGDGSRSTIAVFDYKGRLYQIEAKALPGGTDSAADTLRFQQSLVFTDGGSNRSEDAIRAIHEACPGVPFNPAGLDDPRCPGNARQ